MKETYKLLNISIYADGKLKSLKYKTVNKGLVELNRDQLLNLNSQLELVNPLYDNTKITIKDGYIYSQSYIYNLIDYESDLKNVLKYCKLKSVYWETPISIVLEPKKCDIVYLDIEYTGNNNSHTQILIDNGATKVDNKTVRLDRITAIKWINRDNHFWRWCYDNNIKLKLDYLLIDRDTCEHMEEIKEYREQLNKWLNKAKVLGIMSDYDINEECAYLKQLVNANDIVKIPPIKVIGYNCFDCVNGKVVEMHIPDSVSYIQGNMDKLSDIKVLNLSNNAYSLTGWGKTQLNSLESLDLKNIQIVKNLGLRNMKTLELSLGTKIDGIESVNNKYNNKELIFKYKI